MEDDKYQLSDDEDLHEGSGEDHIQTPENSTTSSSGNCSLSYGSPLFLKTSGEKDTTLRVLYSPAVAQQGFFGVSVCRRCNPLRLNSL